MEGAFTHVGNHLISDSAAAIKAGADDLSAIDPDEEAAMAESDSSTASEGDETTQVWEHVKTLRRRVAGFN